MHTLEKKEGVYVASLIEEITLPTNKSQIKHVLKTVNALFTFKVRLFRCFFNSQNSSSSNLKESHDKTGCRSWGRYGSKSASAKTERYYKIESTSCVSSLRNPSSSVFAEVKEKKVKSECCRRMCL